MRRVRVRSVKNIPELWTSRKFLGFAEGRFPPAISRKRSIRSLQPPSSGKPVTVLVSPATTGLRKFCPMGRGRFLPRAPTDDDNPDCDARKVHYAESSICTGGRYAECIAYGSTLGGGGGDGCNFYILARSSLSGLEHRRPFRSNEKWDARARARSSRLNRRSLYAPT